MTRAEVEEIIVESNPDALFLDGFDDAIIGVSERPNLGPLVNYSQEKIIEILTKEMEADEDLINQYDGDVEMAKYSMAIEYYEYNIKFAWLGEGTPIITMNTFY